MLPILVSFPDSPPRPPPLKGGLGTRLHKYLIIESSIPKNLLIEMAIQYTNLIRVLQQHVSSHKAAFIVCEVCAC